MKKHIFLAALLMIALLGFSQEKSKPKEVNSTLKKVTVFLNGAQATRTAKATVAKGSSQIKFINLPARIQSKSIQVKGEGDFTILSQTNLLNIPDPPIPQPDLAIVKRLEGIEEEKTELNELIAIENNLLAVYNKEEALLLANQNFGTKDEGIKVEDLRAAADLFRTRLLDITQLKQVLLDKIKGYKKEIAKLNKEAVELQKPEETTEELPEPTAEVLVTVSAKATVTGEFTITYLVINAGWLPSYDLKVKDVSSPVELTYKANVFQNSNEDWNNIKLTLSTGNPNKNNAKPNLLAWKLNYHSASTQSSYGSTSSLYQGGTRTFNGRITNVSGESLTGATIVVNGTTVGTFADANGDFSLTVPAGANSVAVNYIGHKTQQVGISGNPANIVLQEDVQSLNEVVVVGYETKVARSQKLVNSVEINKYRNARNAKVRQKAETKTIPLIINRVERATNVEFTMDEPYSIPSDGKRYIVNMKVNEIPAQYEYYCAPKLDLNAYLTAQLTDWEKLNLLEGESRIYFEDTYVGKTLMNVRSLDDTMTVFLGADAAIVVSRTRLKNFSKKKFIGGRHIETRAWEIEVRNQKKDAIQLVIEDQYPVSDNEEIEVELLERSGAGNDTFTGILTWDMKLAAGKSKKLGLKYEVKFPKGRAIRIE